MFAGSSPITFTSPSSEACQKSGPFAPLALPSLDAHTTLSELPPWPLPLATLRTLTSPLTGLPRLPEPPFRRAVPTCMGLFLSSLSAGAHLFSSSVSLFDLEPVSSPRPTYLRLCRAQGLSRLAVAQTLPRAPIIARPHLDSSEHGGTLVVVGMTINEAAGVKPARCRAPLSGCGGLTHEGARLLQRSRPELRCRCV